MCDVLIDLVIVVVSVARVCVGKKGKRNSSEKKRARRDSFLSSPIETA